MKHKYLLSFRFGLKLCMILSLLLSAKSANACHGVAIISANITVNTNDVTITGQSDAATCGCGPYFLQVEVALSPSCFTGNAPPCSDTLPGGAWNNYPWYYSTLNIPGYGPPNWIDQCAQEPYFPVIIPFSQLCSGTTYYLRYREVPCTGTAAPWSTAFSFTTPGPPPPPLAITATASQYTTCVGNSVQLNAAFTGGCPTDNVTYSWMPTTGLNNPNIANPVATVNGAITYTCTATLACQGFTATDTVGIQIGAPPVSGTASANPFSICSGSSSDIVLGGYSGIIQWQISPNGTTWFNISGATNDTLNTGPLSSTVFYQAIVAGTGCGTSTSNLIQVTVSPSPPADAGANTTICSGTSTNLNGSGGVSYNWMPGNLNGANPSVSPASTTTYTVTVTDGNGCTATDQVTVNVSVITANAGNDVTICSGSQATLVATGNGAVSYSWAPPAGLSSTSVSNPVANPTSTSTYVVTTTNTFGCTDNDTIVVNVTPAPPVDAGLDVTICAGGNTTLTATGATQYTWQPGGQLTSSITVSPGSTTTFVVTGDNNGCIDYDTVVVNITPPPAAFAGPDFSICTGNQATLTATGGNSYSWAPGTGIIGNPNQASILIAPTTTTTYSVSVVGPGGCLSQDQLTITVNQAPTVNATAGQMNLCAGGSTTLNASGATSYVWSPSTGLSSPTSPNPTANPTTTTTYTVTGTNANGCTDTQTITITVVQPPTLPGIYGTPTLCGDTTGMIWLGAVAGGQGPYTYTINGSPVTPVNGWISNLDGGSYTIVVTDAFGCTGTGNAGVGVDNSQLDVNATATPSTGVAPLVVNFSSTGNGGINNFLWELGSGGPQVSGQNTTNTYSDPGTYTVIVMGWNDDLQCASYDTLVIVVVPESIVAMPNVFTPNGDGNNDMFMATAEGVKELRYSIFNRWGNKIREVNISNTATEGWDGRTDSGNEAEEGVYYYVLEAVGLNDDVKVLTGFVQLIRTKP